MSFYFHYPHYEKVYFFNRFFSINSNYRDIMISSILCLFRESYVLYKYTILIPKSTNSYNSHTMLYNSNYLLTSQRESKNKNINPYFVNMRLIILSDTLRNQIMIWSINMNENLILNSHIPYSFAILFMSLSYMLIFCRLKPTRKKNYKIQTNGTARNFFKFLIMIDRFPYHSPDFNMNWLTIWNRKLDSIHLTMIYDSIRKKKFINLDNKNWNNFE